MFTKVTTRMGKQVEKVRILGQMEIAIKDSGPQVRCKAKGSTIIPMARCTKASSRPTRDMGVVVRLIQTALLRKESGKMISIFIHLWSATLCMLCGAHRQSIQKVKTRDEGANLLSQELEDRRCTLYTYALCYTAAGIFLPCVRCAFEFLRKHIYKTPKNRVGIIVISSYHTMNEFMSIIRVRII